jgi:hypothetical protein
LTGETAWKKGPCDEHQRRIGTSRVSYRGEIVAAGIERVIASLPPEGVGAAVNILDVCEDEVRMLLSHPERCVLVEGGELPEVIPEPRFR